MSPASEVLVRAVITEHGLSSVLPNPELDSPPTGARNGDPESLDSDFLASRTSSI